MYAVRCATATLMVFMLIGCRVTDWRLWHVAERPADACAIEQLRDISYHDGPRSERTRHRLDLFLPKGQRDYPVVMLVHGGAWMMGDNRCCGLYSSVAEYLATQGIGVVVPNYRLSPGVKHPEHIKDVARAFAWTKRHIGEHGGRPDQLYLVGHSAGGHLVALLTTDEQYLKAEGCRTADIGGTVCVSGVYRIPDGNADVRLGGNSPLSLRFTTMTPLRGECAKAEPAVADKSGLPISINVFGPAFGADPVARRLASPLHHVRRNLPPFLLINADHDLPLLPGMAEEMHRALLLHGCASHLLKVEGRNHNTILFNAINSTDPVARAIIEFVRAGDSQNHGPPNHGAIQAR